MSDQPEIVVIGSVNTDFVSYADQLPKVGETVMGKKFCTNFGGKGANQCIAVAKLGAKVAFVGRVGDDIWAENYIQNFQKHKVNIKHLKKTPDIQTGLAQITVANTGQSNIIIIAGANDALTVKDIQKSKDYITNAKVVVLQLESPIPAVIEGLKLCKTTSILNAAPALTQYDPQLLKLPTIFCVNETETETFTGLTVTNVEQGKVAAQKLISMGCQSVIITLGEQGSVYVDSNKKILHVPAPKVKAVDCTGAGDAFIGSLAFLLSKQKYDMQKCLQVASAVAADSVQRPGAQISYPDASFLKQFDL